ncbi:MAG: ribosomal RNA small subunit methyltransferase A, partial [Puniceicoccales bacterium]|nr:ribosomal RNA small subunit methyltransferase A [Puniceicoccales bacterium]
MRSPSQEIRRQLEQLTQKPQRSLGQNFLHETGIAQKSVDWAQLKTDDSVVEIGPGLGILTEKLLESPVTVYAIEKDPILYRFLTQRWGTESRLFLMPGDALRHPTGPL